MKYDLCVMDERNGEPYTVVRNCKGELPRQGDFVNMSNIEEIECHQRNEGWKVTAVQWTFYPDDEPSVEVIVEPEVQCAKLVCICTEARIKAMESIVDDDGDCTDCNRPRKEKG